MGQLADEPTGNLDPDTTDGSLAAVIATRKIDFAQRRDRFLRLEHGKIVEA